MDARWLYAITVHVRGAISERGQMSYISAWASALLVLLLWAMREPLIVGRAPVWFPRVFFFANYLS